MLQIFVALLGAYFVFMGIRLLFDNDKVQKKTPKTNAIATMIAGLLLLAFALVGIPMLLSI